MTILKQRVSGYNMKLIPNEICTHINPLAERKRNCAIPSHSQPFPALSQTSGLSSTQNASRFIHYIPETSTPNGHNKQENKTQINIASISHRVRQWLPSTKHDKIIMSNTCTCLKFKVMGILNRGEISHNHSSWPGATTWPQMRSEGIGRVSTRRRACQS